MQFKTLALARAAEVVGKEKFKWKISGRMSEEEVAAVLKALISFILDGPTATEQSDAAENAHKQAVLTVFQLLAFNCRRFSRKRS
ncbi:hypothetical protein PoB_004832100 [Plakobranchus ocellatus]|uniref:Uncharacterized protein n=1 Tax=Plakobranchus ocellatus TaxID=259542 RepID=A0AAV4BMY4_9GAST|nr:hypothetical protein PoB_004832100 [Plakobranchus ocellatus]